MGAGLNTFFLIFAVSEVPLADGIAFFGATESFCRYLTFKFLSTKQGALVFFMQTGFAMLCAGSIRAKNTKNVLLW